MLGMPDVEDDPLILVLAVNVQRLRLPYCSWGESFKVRVKYGDPGDSVHCDTCAQKAVWPVANNFVMHLEDEHPCAVEFGMTCLFLAKDRQQSRVRLRLLRDGCCQQVLAKAQVAIPPAGHEVQRYDVPLEQDSSWGCCRWLHCFSPPPASPGCLEVGVQSRYVAKSRLRQYLRLLDAQRQKDAFLVGATPVVEGHVNSRCYSESDSPVHKGQPLSPSLSMSFLKNNERIHTNREEGLRRVI
eukprot:TRINITY_DN38650_c0_g1_i3.p1 TRINITY_DN38650_c0_g1~~TRINITY_DN38650_c0_g1_i3.p1  ORF type:complete len:242 (-),score=31.71 TRINITY_DN38650_c0_g1_i3:28-753(-)